MVANWFICGLLVDGKTGNVVLMGEAISAFTDSIGEEIEGGASEKLGT